MSSLYELTQEWQSIYDMMDDPTIDEATIRDTLESIEGEIEAKAQGYAAVITQLSADYDATKKEIDRLTERKRTIENNISRLKLYLQNAMETTGKTKFKSGLWNFSIQKNPPSVVIDNPALVAEKYLIPQEPKIDRTALKQALQSGLMMNGIAHLEQGSSVRIR